MFVVDITLYIPVRPPFWRLIVRDASPYFCKEVIVPWFGQKKDVKKNAYSNTFICSAMQVAATAQKK